MYNESEGKFEAMVRRTGNSLVITVPKETVVKLSLGEGSGIEVHIRKWKKA